ncbi:hypothetical protein AVEN_220911-1 [Araneus ventricosus]|uniref:Uncharacterized protein n=1 Tax=Araneus ventricosus TaxID=182803 RepID=A0A4Y2DMV3_ARAVE|nr:hypothetical protein AVEN_191273-1 [Araneus ventricosus]GBM17168.1 hypothetical protein AVEN_52287-1 [Araneus ventricosus]GBM17232.1 hypothetical protein AVEN_211631-1 [Araneus ventricosus]GBM17241.1 hypothetical protein AVEN_220911-1 [Araneus ventricosus]
MISKSYLPCDFIYGTTIINIINAIIPTTLPLVQGSLFEILFCTASGKENRASVDVIASFASSSAFSFPRCPMWALIQPSLVLGVLYREFLNGSGYWISGLIGLSVWIGCRSRSLLVWVVLGIFNRFLKSY